MRSCKKREIKKEDGYQFTDVNELFELTQHIVISDRNEFYYQYYNHDNCPCESEDKHNFLQITHITASIKYRSLVQDS